MSHQLDLNRELNGMWSRRLNLALPGSDLKRLVAERAGCSLDYVRKCCSPDCPYTIPRHLIDAAIDVSGDPGLLDAAGTERYFLALRVEAAELSQETMERLGIVFSGRAGRALAKLAEITAENSDGGTDITRQEANEYLNELRKLSRFVAGNISLLKRIVERP